MEWSSLIGMPEIRSTRLNGAVTDRREPQLTLVWTNTLDLVLGFIMFDTGTSKELQFDERMRRGGND